MIASNPNIGYFIPFSLMVGILLFPMLKAMCKRDDKNTQNK